MDISRREFVAASLTGLAGLYAGGAFAADAPTSATALTGEDGYKLWLRYAPPGDAAAARYRETVRQIVVEGTSATSTVIRDELSNGISAMLGSTVPAGSNAVSDHAVVAGTPASSPLIAGLHWDADLVKTGPEGFVIRSARISGHPVTVIASHGEIGALYGTFHFLRLMQTARPIDKLNVTESPKVQLRLLNQWDNPAGTIERGYGGRSIWKWSELPDKLDPRYTDFARANAAIGVNGTVVNNVNADVRMLSPEYLKKLAAVATVLRPCGVRTYLSIRFSSPVELGHLTTADPLDKTVAEWWKAKADEIYGYIPDFGGFLVKANSEGQPGPKDYKRSHAEGANVIADALAPHKGNVIWRAFVYDEDVDADRAKRAYIEFTKLDGQFRPNAVIQVKNGPIDFQPREPFHPLFGALKNTCAIAEVQATQEYMGQAKHLVYLGTMWQEFLDADTYSKGKGSTVGKTLDGSLQPASVTGMVSVTNPGDDRNWCGHHFSQSNWYAFGRLAWNHELSAKDIAEEWTRVTWTNDDKAVAAIRDMMMTSRETYLNYTMPIGLHHMIGGNHYAPQPWNAQAQRPDWTAVYYNQASPQGIGFDRTKTGDKAVEQYFPHVCDEFNDLKTCPEIFLLWFHHCAWDYKMKSGKTLWEELCLHYNSGVNQVKIMQSTWQGLADKIDPRRHQEVADKLVIQATDSASWRQQILAYFATFSKMKIIEA